MHMETISG